MTAGFKHRLLGATILILAGIIFLPDLLDGEKLVVKDDFKVIPDRPEFQGVQQPEPFDQAAFDSASSVAAASQVNETAVDESGDNSVVNEQDADSLPSQAYAQVTLNGESAVVSRQEPAVDNAATPPAAVAENAWVVRVGSFSNPQNANALVAKLRQQGYVTFTRDITNSNGQKLTSVLVGPELRKARLEQQVEELQELTGIARLVVSRYQVTENN